MKVVAVVQARLRSTRLPAKVLLDLGGEIALRRCLDRVIRIQHVAEVVVATSTCAEDELIALAAKRAGARVFRGSEEDVLGRYYGAAGEYGAEAVVRCTSDCPLLDPEISSRVVCEFLASQATSEPLDYASNTLQRRLPRGLDTEIFTFGALERAHYDATDPADREHVTAHIYRRPDRFRCAAVSSGLTEDLSSHRWTLDTLDDYVFLSLLFDALGPNAGAASMGDVLAVVKRRPDLVALNAHVEQKKV